MVGFGLRLLLVVGIAWLLMIKAEPMHGVCLLCFLNPFSLCLERQTNWKNKIPNKMDGFILKVIYR